MHHLSRREVVFYIYLNQLKTKKPMSFWCNTTGYRTTSKNGSTYLNVSGVPGGISNLDTFIRPLAEKLERENLVITPSLVKEAKHRFLKIEGQPMKKLKEHLAFPRTQWLKCLWGEPQSLFVEDEYEYPGAAYLVWWLSNNEGKKIENGFSY